ncbi:Agamous-like MADS-box protein AGL92 [Glycine max]|nr:Agamous-like MADS-box protein AGL92 [Glycine max]
MVQQAYWNLEELLMVGQETLRKLSGLVGKEYAPSKKNAALGLKISTSLILASYLSGGLLNKFGEINTLCDIQACAIIYTPNEPEAKVWPSDQGVNSVISRFMGAFELAISKIMLCQENHLKRNINKAQGQLKKLRNENKKKEIDLFTCQYFADVTLLADKNLEITKKNEILQVQEVTLAIENGGETKTEEKQALVANVDAMPNLNGLMTTMRMIGMGSM